MSTPPKVSVAAATTLAQSALAGDVMRERQAERSPISSATALTSLSSTSVRTTLAPSEANRRPSAAPCPRAAPVMIATLPASRPPEFDTAPSIHGQPGPLARWVGRVADAGVCTSRRRASRAMGAYMSSSASGPCMVSQVAAAGGTHLDPVVEAQAHRPHRDLPRPAAAFGVDVDDLERHRHRQHREHLTGQPRAQPPDRPRRGGCAAPTPATASDRRRPPRRPERARDPARAPSARTCR